MFSVFSVGKVSPKIRISGRPIDPAAFKPHRGRPPTIKVIASGLSKPEAKNMRANIESTLALFGVA